MTELVVRPAAGSGAGDAAGSAAGAVAAAVERWCASVFAPLVTMAEVVAAAIPAGRPPVLADVGAIQPLAYAQLRRPDRLVVGSGLVADPGLLADAPWHLAWWTVDPDE